MKWIQQLYNWVLSWAESKYGTTVRFLLGASQKAFRYALICTLGSVAGAVIGYSIGNLMWLTADGDFSPFANMFFNNIPGFSVALYESIKNLFIQYDFWVIFTAGFTPIPYKVFTISAGAFDINFMMFMLASVISRGARFFIIGWLIWKFGPTIKSFIDKYFNVLALAFTVFLIGGFALIKFAL